MVSALLKSLTEIVKKIIGDEKRITCRPADLIKPELEQMKKRMCRMD